MSGFGGMMSFETGSLENARTVLNNVRLCSLGESLGGVETLISHPATMTHAYLGEEERQRLGITQGLVRLSVGIEDAEDIIGDLEQALGRDMRLVATANLVFDLPRALTLVGSAHAIKSLAAILFSRLLDPPFPVH